MRSFRKKSSMLPNSVIKKTKYHTRRDATEQVAKIFVVFMKIIFVCLIFFPPVLILRKKLIFDVGLSISAITSLVSYLWPKGQTVFPSQSP